MADPNKSDSSSEDISVNDISRKYAGDYQLDENDESNDRVIMARPDQDSAEAAFAFAGGEDFMLDYSLDDEPFNNEVFHAADEELSIVNAYEIGIGYGLDEEELARLTGKPD